MPIMSRNFFRLTLSLLLLACIFLTVLFAAANAFSHLAAEQIGRPPASGSKQQAREASRSTVLAMLGDATRLCPANATYLVQKGQQEFRLGGSAGPGGATAWDMDFARACVLAPSWSEPPRLWAQASWPMARKTAGEAPDKSGELFRRALLRNPTDAHTTYQMAKLAHWRASWSGQAAPESTGQICALLRRALDLAHNDPGLAPWCGEVESFADQACLESSPGYQSMREFKPASTRQWSLLGHRLGKKDRQTCNQAIPLLLKDMQARHLGYNSYQAVALGISRNKPYCGVKVLDAYVRHNPGDAAAWADYVEYLDYRRKFFSKDRIINTIGRARGSARPDCPSWAAMAAVACKLDDFELSGQLVDAALKLEPASIPALMVKGGCLMYQGKYKQAVTVYDEVTGLMPSNPQVWAQKGAAYLKSSDYVRALQAFHRALELDPGNAYAKQGLINMGIN